MMVLASCQDVAQDAGQSEAVAVQSGYPSLYTVPPRPQLSYTVEQRRAIVDGLIADRENARYSSQVARYRTGLSSLPPPDTLPVAAAPLTADPDVSNAGDAPPQDAARDRPIDDPETDFDDDDDLDSFLEELARDGIERPGEIAPGPESNAAPLGDTIVRANAARPVGSPAATYDDPPPGAVWAIPVETAGLPDAPLPAATPATGIDEAAPPPAPVATAVAGRAPGVVWGMVEAPDRPAGPAAVASAAPAASPRTASPAPSSVSRGPAEPESINGSGRRPRPVETTVAGRAPGVVWGMVDMPDRPAAATPVETSDGNGITDGNGKSAEPIVTAVADRTDHRPPFQPDSDAPGIEVGDGVIDVAVAPSDAGDRAVESIVFAPGSATLPPDAAARLERFLAEVKAPDARIRVVGEADAPALALDRAVAVGAALVQRGVPADRLELTLAHNAAGDQARLFLIASAP